MKIKNFWTLGLLLLNTFIFGQNPIPNAGFEDWSGNNPVHWKTSNLPSGNTNNVVPFIPAVSGYAAKGEVIGYPNTPGFPLIPILTNNNDEGGFPVSELFSQATLHYQFHPANPGDLLSIFVGVMDAQGAAFGGGYVEIHTPADRFTEVNIPVNYYDQLQPARAFIYITIDTRGENSLPTLGSYFIVDEVSMTYRAAPGGGLKDSVIKRSPAFPNPTPAELNLLLDRFKNNTAAPDIFDRSGRKIPEGFSGDLPNSVQLCRLSTFGGAMTKRSK